MRDNFRYLSPLGTGLVVTMVAGACSLQPKYNRPAAPIPSSVVTTRVIDSSGRVDTTVVVADSGIIPAIRYVDVFQDERLRWIVSRGVAESRDLRIAISNVEVARAQYGIARWQRLPTVTAGIGGQFGESANSSTNAGARIESYSADVSIPAFEIDLFGRVKSLSLAAQNEYLATREGAHAVRLTLISEIASGYVALAADRTLLEISVQSLRNSERALEIADARHKGEVSSLLEVKQAETSVAQAKADIANLEIRIAQDINALNLLVGETLPNTVLPTTLGDVIELIGDPLNSSSKGTVNTDILLGRPDVLRAEYQLMAANARIGAARAAFLPKLSISSLAGFASGSFGDLFKSDNVGWSVSPSLRATLFDGSLKGGIALTNAQRDLLVAQYERTLQVAFRETADALSRRAMIEAAIAASQARVDAAAHTYELSMARYRAGLDAFIVTLDAQRQLYAAQQALVSVQQSKTTNLINLYKVLGGDLNLRTLSQFPSE